MARKMGAGELKGHSAPTVTRAVTTFCSLARRAKLLRTAFYRSP